MHSPQPVDDVQQLIAEVTELTIQVVQVIDDRPAAPLLKESGLRQQQGRAGGILVAQVIRREDAVALLGRDDEIGRSSPDVAVLSRGIELSEYVRVVLEPHQQIFNDLRAKVSADAADLPRGHFRGDDDRGGR